MSKLAAGVALASTAGVIAVDRWQKRQIDALLTDLVAALEKSGRFRINIAERGGRRNPFTSHVRVDAKIRVPNQGVYEYPNFPALTIIGVLGHIARQEKKRLERTRVR